MDEPEWEELHQQSYRQGAWQRAEWSAGALMRRHTGRDPGDIERIEEEGIGGPAEQAEMLSVWLPVTRLVALALWRSARDAGCRIDDVELHRALWWLDGQYTSDLFSDPLPSWTGLPGSWRRLEARLPDLGQRAYQVVLQQLAAHERDPLAETDTGAPVLLGDRVRAIRSEPYRDSHGPRWKFAVDHATEVIREGHSLLTARLWKPSPLVQEVAAQLHPTLVSDPDTPPAPSEAAGPAWIQRLVRLTHIDTTIGIIRDHHRGPGDGDLAGSPAAPFGQAVAATSVALREIRPTALDLEELWSRRTEDVVTWERQHLPRPVRAHVVALENLVVALSRLAFHVRHLDEPH
ncbi:hypothetical protein ABZ766_33885 [Streptomyces sp. NPDC006670]|uniref:hypothetical protein n=1 Tax=Streptomyces sp. NPDC006670 TaxID=3154476 RepID=UPI0033F04464